MHESVAITVVISTYNRRATLIHAIESVLAQDSDGISYEVIVVDNNSTDGTKDLVESFRARSNGRLRYVYEVRQGVSYARNAGIREARGKIVAFCDDDVQAMRGWVAAIKRAFDLHPEADFIGGKVLPQWENPPPAWLTKHHWSPVALLDYGDEPFHIDAANPLCLLTANLAVRRDVFRKVGLFSLELQKVEDSVGSMEDHELLVRCFRAGCRGWYAPEIMVTTEVPASRTQKAYHRRWHRGHGHFYAIMRSEDLEPPSAPRLLDVPAYLYKQALKDCAGWLTHSVLRNETCTTACEMRLQFFLGFFRKRREDFLKAHSSQDAAAGKRDART